jgi:hypothetical protein
MRPCGACACAAIALSLAGPARAADPPPRPAPIEDAASKPARPPLPPEPARTPLPWAEHLEIGGGLAISALLASSVPAGQPPQVRLKPNAGFHIRMSWEVLRYLWFTGYLVESAHALDLPPGALGLPGTLTGGSAHLYTFGARVSPTLPLGSRARLWLTAGAGWGRIAYPRLCPQQPCTGAFMVRERAATMVEVPIGLGAAFELIPRWLRLHLELTGSLLPSQIGEARETGQVIDAAGKKRDVGPMPHLEGSIVQTIGLSLVL